MASRAQMSDMNPCDGNELIERAQGVAKALRPYEAQSEQARKLHPDAVNLIREADLFKVVQPKRIGGFEANIQILHAVGKALSFGCAASAWVYMVTGAHTWILGMYPEQAQDEIKATDADTILPGSLAANGVAERVDGGFRCSGHWQFASGCDYGSWALLCSRQSDSTREDPKHIHYFVPVDEVEIEDTWHTLGLRGTGSKDLRIHDVFVPQHRAMATGDLFEATSAHAKAHDTFYYRFPVLATLSYFVTAPALAIAHRVYQEFVGLTAARRDRYDGSSKAKKATLQARVAESWAEIQSAELLVKEIGETFAAHANKRAALNVDTRLQIKMSAAYAIALCRRSADRLFDAAGANGIYERSPLLSLQKNLHTMSHHAIIDFDNNAAAFGSNALGLGPGTILY